MLTVDYDKLGVRPGDLLLDLGCGFGRHAFEGFRRGARVVACDMSTAELIEVRGLIGAMVEGRRGVTGHARHLRQRRRHPAALRRRHVRRIIASEVMEHIPDDLAALDELARVLKPGGVLAVTIPAWLPEKVCWALSDEYHAPIAVGGHVRIYTENELRSKMQGAGLSDGAAHHAHALHSPYWWLKCAVGTTNDDFPLVKLYHRLLVWDITKHPALTRVSERLLNPVLGKSLVVYATKPMNRRGPAAAAVESTATRRSSSPVSDSPARLPRETADVPA